MHGSHGMSAHDPSSHTTGGISAAASSLVYTQAQPSHGGALPQPHEAERGGSLKQERDRVCRLEGMVRELKEDNRDAAHHIMALESELRSLRAQVHAAQSAGGTDSPEVAQVEHSQADTTGELRSLQRQVEVCQMRESQLVKEVQALRRSEGVLADMVKRLQARLSEAHAGRAPPTTPSTTLPTSALPGVSQRGPGGEGVSLPSGAESDRQGCLLKIAALHEEIRLLKSESSLGGLAQREGEGESSAAAAFVPKKAVATLWCRSHDASLHRTERQRCTEMLAGMLGLSQAQREQVGAALPSVSLLPFMGTSSSSAPAGDSAGGLMDQWVAFLDDKTTD